MLEQNCIFKAVNEELRDRAIDILELHRKALISLAGRIAEEINETNGRVTSTEVLREMHILGFQEDLRKVDKRFMGVVFRKGWERIGFEPTGSHSRPISIWRKAA